VSLELRDPFALDEFRLGSLGASAPVVDLVSRGGCSVLAAVEWELGVEVDRLSSQLGRSLANAGFGVTASSDGVCVPFDDTPSDARVSTVTVASSSRIVLTSTRQPGATEGTAYTDTRSTIGSNGVRPIR